MPTINISKAARRRGSFLPSLICLAGKTADRSSTVSVRVMIDSGSDFSYVKRSVASRLTLSETNLTSENVKVFGGGTATQRTSSCTLYLMPIFSSSHVLPLPLQAVDVVCSDLPPLNLTVEELPDIAELNLTEQFPRGRCSIDVLIGQDHLWDVISGGQVKGSKGSKLIVWQTCLGSAVSGRKTTGHLDLPATLTKQMVIEEDQDLGDILQRFWSLESLGIRDERNVNLSPDEKFALDHFNANTTFDGVRYCVRLPFHPDKVPPLNNHEAALGQFKSLERTLLRSKVKHDLYVAAMDDYIQAGHVELVSTETPEVDVAFYLPHHAVYRSDSVSHKIRIVFNGSTTDLDGLSLNSVLLAGPALQPDLAAVIMRFRQYPVALTGDIRKHFLQIQVNRLDRKWLRFLWKPPGSAGPVQTYHFCVIAFGLSCAPFLAINTVLHHLTIMQYQYPAATQILRNSLYVDDCLAGGPDAAAVIQLRSDISVLMAAGGFVMTKWCSNSPEVMESIPVEDRAPYAPVSLAEKDLTLTPGPIPTALGLMWDPTLDAFQFQGALELMRPLGVETMRTLCSRAARLFDPLGFLSPFILLAKCLMQECWKLSLCWDDPLPDSILEPWEQWVGEITYLHYLDIARCVFIKNMTGFQIHSMSDASERACAAVTYVRSVDATGNVLVRLLCSKTVVAPLKKQSIPRLELVAMQLMARLTRKVVQDLPPCETILWSDSTVAIQWASRPPSFWKTYVGNRVAAIQSCFPPEHFRYIPTRENSSDVASRGAVASKLIAMHFWWRGPIFLEEDEDCWPDSPLPTKIVKLAAVEEQPPMPFVLATVAEEIPPLLKEIFSPGGPGTSFWKSLRLLAFVQRFVHNLKSPREAIKSKWPTKSEMDGAFVYWVQCVQQQAFSKEMTDISNKSVAYKGKLAQLQPFVSEGILKVGGRLTNAKLPEEEKHPWILPSQDEYVHKYVLAIHQALGHPGPETTLCHLRTKTWLLMGRREVKSALRKCVRCYRLRAKPFTQTMAPLPARRLDYTFAFVHVGLDFCGPFSVLVESAVAMRGRKRAGGPDDERWQKVWVLVITCMTTRMAHMEYVFSQETGDFINALHRFISRRGMPSSITSDNSRTFEKANRETFKLYRSIDWDALQKEFLKPPARIQWIFNPPLAPHFGGVFERVVGTLKKALRATLGRERATEQEFYTTLCRAEAVLNSRPLTAVSSDPEDPLPLSPAHLALGRGLSQIPDNWGRDDYNDPVAVLWKNRSRLHAEFAGRWRREYLQTLQALTKWSGPGGVPPRVGEIVLVEAAPRSRLFWPMAKILQVHEGRDGKVRACTLWLKQERTRRDLRHIFRLEAVVTEQQLEMQQQREQQQQNEQQQQQQLPLQQRIIAPPPTRRQQRQLWPQQQ